MLLRLRRLRHAAVAVTLASTAVAGVSQSAPGVGPSRDTRQNMPGIATSTHPVDANAPAANEAGGSAEAEYYRTHPQMPVRYFHLHNSPRQEDANEILVALRNINAPFIKVYLVASKNTIVMAAPESQLDLAAQIIHELDVPRRAYKLTYTVTTVDNGKPTGTEHLTQLMVAGQRATLKQGNKIPVVTGTFKPESSTSESQFTYLDIGMNIDATIENDGNGVSLLYKVEQSSVAPDSVPIAGINEPVVRQAVIQGAALLAPSKPVILGGIDIPGSTRHLDIAVSLEPLS